MEIDQNKAINLISCPSKRLLYLCNSVPDPWHLGTDADADADPRIHIFDQWIWIGTKSSVTFRMQKIYFFLKLNRRHLVIIL